MCSNQRMETQSYYVEALHLLIYSTTRATLEERSFLHYFVPFEVCEKQSEHALKDQQTFL